MDKFNYYTNEDLLKGVNKIARQMVNQQLTPDIVVGVLRGGVIPAVYLSHWFSCPMMAIEWSTRDNAVGQSIDDKIIQDVKMNKTVLIVDDICDSGLTLRQIYDYINERAYPEMLKSAVLHYNIGQDVFEPDFYHLEINKVEDPRWVVYEWEDV